MAKKTVPLLNARPRSSGVLGSRNAAGNAAVVLNEIRRSMTGMSRTELAERIGLAPQTLTDLTKRLLDAGLVRESRTQHLQRGKPRTILEIVPDARYAVGIHIDPTQLSVVLTDLSGQVVAERQNEIALGISPDAVVARVSEGVSEMLDACGVSRARVLGAGVATPGPIDVDLGRVLGPPHLPGWDDVPLRSLFAAALDLPVLLDKDVTAAAFAERWAGPEPQDRTFVLLYLGTGVGASVIQRGNVLRGTSGNAGDIGTIASGRAPGATLGHELSPATIVTRAREAGIQLPPTVAGDSVAALRVLKGIAVAADDDPRAADVLRSVGESIGVALVSAAAFVDADLAVIAGPAWEPISAHCLPAAIDHVESAFPLRRVHGLQVRSSALGLRLAALGASCLLLDDVFATRPHELFT